MKNGIIFIAALLIIASCKKPHYQNCSTCVCFNTDTFNAHWLMYSDTSIDSLPFFQTLLGTWYVKEHDTLEGMDWNTCIVQCYCDTQYYVVFLANDSVIVNLPHISRNTVSYSFFSMAGKIYPQNCYLFYSDSMLPAQINYAGIYWGITFQIPTPGTLSYPPHYYLTRH